MQADDEDAGRGRVVNYGVQSAGGSVQISRSAIGRGNVVHAEGDDYLAGTVGERVAAVRAELRRNEAAFADPAVVDDELTAIERHLDEGGRDPAYLGRRLGQIVQAFQVAGIVAAPVAALAEVIRVLTGG